MATDKLEPHEIRESNEERETPRREFLFHGNIVSIELVLKIECVSLGLAFLEKVVELGNQLLVSRDVSHETFRNKDSSEVLTLICSLSDDVRDSVHDVWQGLVSEGALLRDDDHVWMGLESALQGQVGRLSTH